MFTTVTLAALFATAFAAPTELAPRQCQNRYLPTLWTINSLRSGYPSVPHTDQILITRQSGPTKGFFDTIVEFKGIPAGAYGCQFELDYQPGHHGYFSNQEGQAERVNVYQVVGDMPAEVTWATMESKKGSLVGTFSFPKNAEELATPKKIIINSFQCSETMRFRLSINEQSLGYIENWDDATSGLRVTHNC